MNRLVLVLLILSSVVVNSLAQITNDYDIQYVIAAAKNELYDYLERIPQNQEPLYGFNNRAEFKIAKLGKPYRVLTLNKEFFDVTLIKNDKIYLEAIDEYRIPIDVGGEYRALLTVAKKNGTWKTVGLGAAKLAKELRMFEIGHSSLNSFGTMLRVYQWKSDFILINDLNLSSIRAYPLLSAKIALTNRNVKLSNYLLNDLLNLIKNDKN